jgi:hypothetical protein
MDRSKIKNPYTEKRMMTPNASVIRAEQNSLLEEQFHVALMEKAFNEGVDAAAAHYEGIMAERIETAVNNALNRFLEKYDKEIIPQKIKEAEGEIFAELEDQLTPAYPDPATDQIHYYTLDKDDLLKMKKDRGI